MIQEVFIETCWEDAESARQKRDMRRQELEAAGMQCRIENLYRVPDGHQVFVVEAIAPESVAPVEEFRSKTGKQRTTPRLRHRQGGKRVVGYEQR